MTMETPKYTNFLRLQEVRLGHGSVRSPRVNAVPSTKLRYFMYLHVSETTISPFMVKLGMVYSYQHYGKFAF